MPAVRNDKINVENSPNKLDDGPGQPSVVVSYKQQLSFGSFTWTGKLRTYQHQNQNQHQHQHQHKVTSTPTSTPTPTYQHQFKHLKNHH